LVVVEDGALAAATVLVVVAPPEALTVETFDGATAVESAEGDVGAVFGAML
jgi:hypothetical protein